MKQIPATPEGREGIYLVTQKDMIDWLQEYPHDEIHSYLPGPVMLGADWSKQSVIEEVGKAERLGILTGDAARNNFGHALAVISDNKLKIFDIGPITDSDILLQEDRPNG